MQNRRCQHRPENQPAGKAHEMRKDRGRRRNDNQKRNLQDRVGGRDAAAQRSRAESVRTAPAPPAARPSGSRPGWFARSQCRAGPNDIAWHRPSPGTARRAPIRTGRTACPSHAPFSDTEALPNIAQIMPTQSSATLSGQVAIPLSVSGVTAPPSEIPISTKTTRASGAGIVIGRPASAASADRDHRAGQPAGRHARRPSGRRRRRPPSAAFRRI